MSKVLWHIPISLDGFIDGLTDDMIESLNYVSRKVQDGLQ
jgi:hypothetical protein